MNAAPARSRSKPELWLGAFVGFHRPGVEEARGYVGWPLWYHRVCLEHNRRFGWPYILGLAAGAVWNAVRI